MAEEQTLKADSRIGNFRGGAPQGGAIYRAGRGRRQPAVRAGRHTRSPPSRSRCRCSTSTPPTRSFRPSRCVTRMSPSCWCSASCCSRSRYRFRNSHPLVGHRAGRAVRRHSCLCDRGRGRFHRSRHNADQARRHSRRDLHRAVDRGVAPHHRADRAGNCARLRRLHAGRAVSAARPGIIAATASTPLSVICSSRWKAFSAFRSTWRRR